MITIATRMLRSHWASMAAAFLTLMAAAAVACASGVLMESGLRAEVPTERYAAAAIVIGGRQTIPGDDADMILPERVRVPASLVNQLRSVPGVKAAVEDRTVPVGLVGVGPAALPTWGHGWMSARLRPFHLHQGRAPRGLHEVVLDQDLARHANVRLGSPIDLSLVDGVSTYQVVGIVTGPDGSALHEQSAVFFADEEVARRTDPSTVDAIGVLVADDVRASQVTEEIRRIVQTTPSLQVFTGSQRGRPELLDAADDAASVVAIAGTFGGMALAVAVFVVAGTVGLSVEQRQRETGLLRAVGATTSQVRRQLIMEILVLAGSAGAVGSVLGFAITEWVRAAFMARGLLTDDFTLVFSPLPGIIAFGAVGAIGSTAAAAASHRTSRISAMAALAEADVEPRPIGWIRTATGLLSLGAVGLLVPAALSATGDSAVATALGLMFLAAAAVALLGPLVTRWPSRALAWPLRLAPVTGHLAAANVRSHARRTAGLIAPIVLGVGFVTTGLVTQSTAGFAVDQQVAAANRAELVVTGPILPTPLAESVGEMPGVAGVTAVANTTVVAFPVFGGEADSGMYPAQGIQTHGSVAALDLDVSAGELDCLVGDTVALSEDRAHGLHAGLGDSIPLLMGDGSPVDLTVVAIYRRGLGFPEVTLPRDLVLDHTTTGMDDRVLVKVRGDVDVDTVHTQLRSLTAAFGAVTVQRRDEMLLHQSSATQADSWVTAVVLAILAALISITVVNAAVISTVQRSRELSLLRLLGASKAQLLSMMAAEGIVLVTTAVGFGALAAAASVIPMSVVLTGQATPTLSMNLSLRVAGLAAVVTLTPILLTTVVLLSRRPVNVIGSRD